MSQDKWSRQVSIPGFGDEEQRRLSESHVAVLGLGGVGCPAALYLTAAGIGSLILVDRDVVEISNLNRQILFCESDLGCLKAEAAGRRLLSLNPGMKVKTVTDDLKESDMPALLEGCQFVLDCFDRNADRLAVNRVCMSLGIPASHGFAQDFSGEVFNVIPGESACLACALDENFPEPDITPVMGVTTGLVGTAMAATAILNLTQLGDPAAGERTIYDLAFSTVLKIPVERNPCCSVCMYAQDEG
jgi:molybdopterin/thiamine biosynthesis adenylyltransferase